MNDAIYSLAATSFEAARCLPRHGYHGHSFRVHVLGDADDSAAALNAAVAPLDYALLNDHLDSPTDTAIARHLVASLNCRPAGLTLRSAPACGVEIDARDDCYIWAGFRFEAAHRLPYVPEEHKCARWHGHGFRVILYQSDKGDTTDMAAAWAGVAKQLDGACLNDLPGLENPTSEMIAPWLWTRLSAGIAGLACIGVFETRTSGCVFDGQRFRIWKSKYFESAVPAAPASKHLSGHSYWLRLHLAGDLDRVHGWVRDFGDVKAGLNPVYRQLDHHRLDQLQGRPATDLPGLLRWLDERLIGALPELAAVELWSDSNRGGVLCREAPGVAALL